MGIWAWCNYSCWPSLYHFLLTGKDLLLTLASHKLSIVLAPRLVWCRGRKDRPFSLFAKDASRRVIGTNHMVLVSIINIFCQLSNRILHRHVNPGQCHANDGIFSYKSLSAMTKYGIISVQYPFWILNFRECMWHHCVPKVQGKYKLHRLLFLKLRTQEWRNIATLRAFVTQSFWWQLPFFWYTRGYPCTFTINLWTDPPWSFS